MTRLAQIKKDVIQKRIEKAIKSQSWNRMERDVQGAYELFFDDLEVVERNFGTALENRAGRIITPDQALVGGRV